MLARARLGLRLRFRALGRMGFMRRWEEQGKERAGDSRFVRSDTARHCYYGWTILSFCSIEKRVYE
jgi:hypothetical protein